ncbi:PPK2 family polyphosphate kinase [Bizionia sediminis]|uniref:PPK2 family polyphosphate kinase n=1 Tax=Bizionia sediminis TaxID=1737064 RepID=A0ABW5KPG6_9FLAO
MKSIHLQDFKAQPTVPLQKHPTNLNLEADDAQIEQTLKKACKKLAKIQNAMYAHGKYAVLICIQGMDTAGKDSLIREVFKEFNARGIVVHSFKTPTALELRHNYLWRHYVALPERGKFSVFNRTHYENVLITRVHPEYILNENLPNVATLADVNHDFWERRFEEINNFEKTISQNGTLIFKFFLNISKDEQKNRLLRRLHKPNKQWKFSPSDLEERKLWGHYQACYQDLITKTSKPYAPWFIIPSDHKPTARYVVAKILLDTLKTYDDIKEPELDETIKDNLAAYINQLEND